MEEINRLKATKSALWQSIDSQSSSILPPELFQYILRLDGFRFYQGPQHLQRLSAVCKLWHKIIYAQALPQWHKKLLAIIANTDNSARIQGTTASISTCKLN